MECTENNYNIIIVCKCDQFTEIRGLGTYKCCCTLLATIYICNIYFSFIYVCKLSTYIHIIIF